jgi:hypothetical protein
MEGETMVGHDQYNAIPEGEQYPLWQGKQNKAWKPVLYERAYWSPDGQIQDTVGIFCTAANDKRGRYRKGRKWKTHDEMQDWYRLAAEARAAEPARRAAAAVTAAKRKDKDARKNAEQKRTGLIPIKTKAKPEAKPDWEIRMDEACAPEREPKRRRSDELELGHRLTYDSNDSAYDSNEDDLAYDSNCENPGTGGPVSRKNYTYNQNGQRRT